MAANSEGGDGMRWPISGLENVQVQFTDAFGNQLQQATLTESQLQELSQAGFTLTMFQYPNTNSQTPSTSAMNQMNVITNDQPVNNSVQGILENEDQSIRYTTESTTPQENGFLNQQSSENIHRSDSTIITADTNFVVQNSGHVIDAQRVGNEYQFSTERSPTEISHYVINNQVALEGNRLIVDSCSEQKLMPSDQKLSNIHTKSDMNTHQRNIEESLQQLQALNKIPTVNHNQQHHEPYDTTEMIVSSANSSAFPVTQAQSSVIMNVDGVRQEIPITFNLDGKQYELTNLEDYQALTMRSALKDESQNMTTVRFSENANGEHLPASKEVSFNSASEEVICQSETSIKKANFMDIGQPQVNAVQNLMSSTSTGEFLAMKKENEGGLSQIANDSKVIEQSETEDTPDFLDTILEQRIEPARKSERLARRERSELVEVITMFDPNTKAYNVNEQWCEGCKRTYSGGCEQHAVQHVYDKVVLSRAWASLPPLLAIYKLKDEQDADLGVFAKKSISKYMQFGPFVAELIKEKSEITDTTFPLSIEFDTTVNYLKTVDEDKCNWMMFVRPAENYKEQNLVAHQFGPDIFFTVIKNIKPKDELKVWYAAHYAHRIGAELHPVEDHSKEELDQGGKFECYQCDASFKSAALLETHLNDHERREPGATRAKRELTSRQADVSGSEDETETADTTFDPKQESSTGKPDDKFQSWKKRKRNMYFSKIKKYKEMSKRLEQKKEGNQSSNDVSTDRPHALSKRSCQDCDFIFDSETLCKIHALGHKANLTMQKDVIAELSDEIVQWLKITVGVRESSSRRKLTVDGEKKPMTMKCPACYGPFTRTQDLIEHVVKHAKVRKTPKQTVFKRARDPSRPYPCNMCSKSFATPQQMSAHTMTHTVAPGDRKKSLKCDVCGKRLANNSALACHMKIHSADKYFTCPMCREGFDQKHSLKIHAKQHLVGGLYPCSMCHKAFHDLPSITKHHRMSHQAQNMPCPVCEKVFPRADKLRLHMLRHNDVKDFMCDQCGRQFKRKDKLKEHVKRMHNPACPKVVRQFVARTSDPNRAKFTPRVQPTEFHRFIYKCHQCLLGFKRRGMLVNHLAKRHPTIKPEMVPELNLPILRTQRDYFCQYCDKVYKSSSKRKNHIMKNHPGAELPMRQSQTSGYPFLTDAASFSQCVGSITTNPVQCSFCHRQYASKAKMMQHLRKDHPSEVMVKRVRISQEDESKGDETLIEYHDGAVVTVQSSGDTGDVQHADLLTQAMSELTQTLDYRQSQNGATEFQITLPHISQQLQTVDVEGQRHSQDPSGGPIVVTPGEGQTTLDLAVLGQALMQGGFTATIVTDQTANSGNNHNEQTGHSDHSVVQTDQQQLIIDQSVVSSDHHLVVNHVDGQTAGHGGTFKTENIVNGALEDPHTVVIANASHQQQGDIVDAATAMDSDGAGLSVQTVTQTQTITVPLSLASQLISKTWNQASHNHVMK